MVETFDVHTDGERLDRLLANQYPEQSRSYFAGLIERGMVKVNGLGVKKRIKPSPGDRVEVEFALIPEMSLEPEKMDLDVIYEDEWLLAVNKPAGLVVHPGIGNWSGTFVNGLLHYCGQLPGSEKLRPGIVHRLDKDTSGVLVAAKDERARQGLVDLFAKREMEKEYLAVCIGSPGNVTIEAPIGRHPKDRRRMTIVEGGRESTTRVEVIAFDGKLAVVRLYPKTGRTHQLRVHLQHHRNPILGDQLYGASKWNKEHSLNRQMLHARRLAFIHPVTGQELAIEAPMPTDMDEMVEKIR